MPILGWSASFCSSARARYGMPQFAAFFMAFAVFFASSYTRAQARVTLPADTEYPIHDAHALILAIRDEDPAAHKAAVAVLKAAKPEMIAQLLRYGSGPSQRETAQKVVVMMGRKATGAVFGLLKEPDCAAAAGSVLFRLLETADSDRIPDLIACAEGVPQAKGYCAQSLVKVSGPKAAAHAGALIKALQSSEPLVRSYAAAALGVIGRPAAAAAPALRKALKDSAPEVRVQAKTALGKIGA